VGGLRGRTAAVVTLTTDLPGRTEAPAPELDELLAVRRATDLRFAGSRHEASGTPGGAGWVGAAVRATVALVVAFGVVLALGLLGGRAVGELDWLFVATGALALALWATRPDGVRVGDTGPVDAVGPVGDVGPVAPRNAPPG